MNFINTAASDEAALAPGFADPIAQSQQVFRAILSVMAKPGAIETITDLPETPLSLSPVAVAISLTLLDADTPYWLADHDRSDVTKNYIAFHTGAPFAGNSSDAQFVFANDLSDLPDWTSLKQGTPEYPDRSATLILHAGDFNEGHEVELSGPGIKTTNSFKARALTKEFWERAQQNHERFPLGLDFIFVSNEGLAALPRSTMVRI